MLKADFHIHSYFSPDSEMSPESIASRCVDVGLNCIAVTDHNTIDGALAVSKIATFNVIIGEEVGSSEGEITGLFLEETIPRGLGPVETAKRLNEQGGLVPITHPFDRSRGHVITLTDMHAAFPYASIHATLMRVDIP